VSLGPFAMQVQQDLTTMATDSKFNADIKEEKLKTVFFFFFIGMNLDDYTFFY
jgi:hypothetical protein